MILAPLVPAALAAELVAVAGAIAQLFVDLARLVVGL